ncbi:class I SAM-dependent methyltransferase [Denitrobaculum tricleocarpae]|uniref:class I SAM-dependent methyltransferase n=1 Tax=Denitrobaculum tricleocarpae TaxID=2591009 RepID=UPI0015D15F85|nr:class I SAM-dependent methyltransferase [Denitrobaculum tricleocarpae]
MDGFYEDADSLFVEAYDAFYRADLPQISDDTSFYAGLAEETGGPLLELACGTGRITLPLAEAGLEIAGADLSEGMLKVARTKSEALTEAARAQLRLIHQDMTALKLDERFKLALIPFRSFQHLLTREQQWQALEGIRNQLMPGGRLALHLFDPRFDFLIDEEVPTPGHSGVHPVTGRQYIGEILRTCFDHLAQVRRDVWRYAELGEDGEVLREATREMALRWTYRWELHYLLKLCGFAVEAEYSDFNRTPPAYGKELIVVARRT